MGAYFSQMWKKRDFLGLYFFTGGFVELAAICQNLALHAKASPQQQKYLRSHMLVLLYLSLVRFHFALSPRSKVCANATTEYSHPQCYSHPNCSCFHVLQENHRLAIFVHLAEGFVFFSERFRYGFVLFCSSEAESL